MVETKVSGSPILLSEAGEEGHKVSLKIVVGKTVDDERHGLHSLDQIRAMEGGKEERESDRIPNRALFHNSEKFDGLEKKIMILRTTDKIPDLSCEEE
jgi:hypothetical protein